MASLKIDLIDGADYTKEKRKNLLVHKATRVAVVSGLEIAGEGRSCLVRARAFVEAAYPIGSPYDPQAPGCVVVGYRTEPLESSDVVKVRLMYDTPELGGGGDSGGGGTPLTISDSSSLVEETSQLDPADGSPIDLVWMDPKNQKNRIQRVVTCTFARVIRTIVLAGVVKEQNMDRYRNAVGTVNAQRMVGYPKGYWLFRDMNDTTLQGAKFYFVQISIATKKTTDWATYPWLRNNDTGEFVRVDHPKMRAFYKSEYKYGLTSFPGAAAGIAKLGPYPLSNLNALLGIS